MRKQYETDLKEIRRRYKKMRRKKKNTMSNVLTNVVVSPYIVSISLLTLFYIQFKKTIVWFLLQKKTQSLK